MKATDAVEVIPSTKKFTEQFSSHTDDGHDLPWPESSDQLLNGNSSDHSTAERSYNIRRRLEMRFSRACEAQASFYRAEVVAAISHWHLVTRPVDRLLYFCLNRRSVNQK